MTFFEFQMTFYLKMAEVKLETGEKQRQIVPFPGTAKSVVWTWFGFWSEGGKLNKSKAVCRLCQKEYSYQGLCYFK